MNIDIEKRISVAAHPHGRPEQAQDHTSTGNICLNVYGIQKWGRTALLGWLLTTILLVSGCQFVLLEGDGKTLTTTLTETSLVSDTPEAGIQVDATRSLGEINPLVYGTNYGPWLVVTPDVMDEFQASGLTLLRFPAGRYGDTHNIKPHHIDTLMSLAEMIDAEVTISVRLLGGTPELAAEMVRYTNLEKGYGVHYWSIGNEPSLYVSLQDAAGWDTDFYNEQWRIFADAMLAVDPTIELIGPNIHQFAAEHAARPKDENGNDWMDEFLRANGDMVDVIAVHRYPFPIRRMRPWPTIDELRDNVYEWDQMIPALRKTIREQTGRDLPISVMEINSNWSDTSGGDATPDSYYNAIWWADVLGRMIEQRVDMVAHFALQHRQSGWGMLARTEARPTYYVYQLYQRFGQQLLFSQSDDPLVSIHASIRDDGALTILLINLADEATTMPLDISNWTGEPLATETWQLNATDYADIHNVIDLGATSLAEPITVPEQSITLYVVKQP